MVIMAIVLALATLSLSQFSSVYGEGDRRFGERVDDFLRLDRFIKIVESTVDYYYRVDQRQKLYFAGTEQQFYFVSAQSWLQNDQTSINKVSIEPYSGGQRLVLQTIAFKDAPYFIGSQMPDWEQLESIPIITGARQIQLRYLGPTGLRQVLEASENGNYLRALEWTGNYDAADTDFLPEKVSVDIEWPDDTNSSMIFLIRSMNFSKAEFMRDD